MDPVFANTAAALKTPQSPDQARQIAEEFEASFLSVMMNTMMEGVGNDPLTGGGYAQDTYRSMLTEEYAKAITDAGGIGVADQIYREMIKLQETTQ